MPPFTPDGRYLIVRGRLWRATDPRLTPAARERLVSDLMKARSDVRGASGDALKDARQRVHEAKVALGERGPVWWSDGTPDLNRKLVKNTPYRAWFEALAGAG